MRKKATQHHLHLPKQQQQLTSFLPMTMPYWKRLPFVGSKPKKCLIKISDLLIPILSNVFVTLSTVALIPNSEIGSFFIHQPTSLATRDAYRGGAGGSAAPSAFFHGGQEGQELSQIQRSLHLSYLVKGNVPAF